MVGNDNQVVELLHDRDRPGLVEILTTEPRPERLMEMIEQGHRDTPSRSVHTSQRPAPSARASSIRGRGSPGSSRNVRDRTSLVNASAWPTLAVPTRAISPSRSRWSSNRQGL